MFDVFFRRLGRCATDRAAADSAFAPVLRTRCAVLRIPGWSGSLARGFWTGALLIVVSSLIAPPLFAQEYPSAGQDEVEVPSHSQVARWLRSGGDSRQEAMGLLRQLGYHDLVRPAAKYLLDSDDPYDHRAVLRMMRGYGDDLEQHLPDWYKFVDKFIDRDKPPDILRDCIDLAEYWKEHRLIHAVAKLAVHPRQSVREKAFAAMTVMENDQIIPVLMRLLTHKRPIYRIYALDALVNFSDKRIASQVQALFDDQSKSVRIYAIKGALEQPESSESSIIRLFRTDPSPEVRRRVVEVIGNRGWGRHRGVVHRAISDSSGLVREAGLDAARRLGDRSAAGAISRQLETETEKHLKLKAIALLMELDRAAGSDGLEARLRDEDEEVRRRAAVALGVLESRGGIDALHQALLTDQSERVRLEAAGAIGAIGRRDSRFSLLQSIENRQESYAVRSAALVSLMKILGDASLSSLREIRQRMVEDAFERHLDQAILRLERERAYRS